MYEGHVYSEFLEMSKYSSDSSYPIVCDCISLVSALAKKTSSKKQHPKCPSCPNAPDTKKADLLRR